MCLSSLLLKNTDPRYVTENDEYSLWDGDDLGLKLSAGRFRSGIKESLAVTGTVVDWKGLEVWDRARGSQAHRQILGMQQ